MDPELRKKVGKTVTITILFTLTFSNLKTVYFNLRKDSQSLLILLSGDDCVFFFKLFSKDFLWKL